jgi:hypothetical protein
MAVIGRPGAFPYSAGSTPQRRWQRSFRDWRDRDRDKNIACHHGHGFRKSGQCIGRSQK